MEYFKEYKKELEERYAIASEIEEIRKKIDIGENERVKILIKKTYSVEYPYNKEC